MRRDLIADFLTREDPLAPKQDLRRSVRTAKEPIAPTGRETEEALPNSAASGVGSGATIRSPQEIPKRFWKHVAKDDGGCWRWTGSLRQGYGRYNIHKPDGRWSQIAAHRVLWESLNGLVPDGLQLDHLCRNRSCVNPAHLEVVTPRENVLRGEGLPAQNARKTHCSKGHEFTPENTARDAKGRHCRTCWREKDHRRYQREKAARAESEGQSAHPLSPAPDSAHEELPEEWRCKCGRRNSVSRTFCGRCGLSYKTGVPDVVRSTDLGRDDENSGGSGGANSSPSPALVPDSAHEDLQRAYEETVDPMFDRYDEGDWI